MQRNRGPGEGEAQVPPYLWMDLFCRRSLPRALAPAARRLLPWERRRRASNPPQRAPSQVWTRPGTSSGRQVWLRSHATSPDDMGLLVRLIPWAHRTLWDSQIPTPLQVATRTQRRALSASSTHSHGLRAPTRPLVARTPMPSPLRWHA